jgi:hypothetical protein
MDAADYLSYKSGFDQAAYFGDVMGRRLYSRYHLEHFAGQISRFKPCNDTDAACLKIAKAAYDLWQSCPDSNLYGHIPAGIDDDDENEEPPIRIYEYVSFIADTKGQLYESLSECINSEFNEKSGIDEPLVKKVYDRSYDPTGSLEFEYRLFDLLNDLAGLLNDMP